MKPHSNGNSKSSIDSTQSEPAYNRFQLIWYSTISLPFFLVPLVCMAHLNTIQ